MKNDKTMQMLVEKVENIERTVKKIEFELDEVIYPPEENIKKEFIEQIEQAKKEKAHHYKSAEEFFSKLEKENV